MAMLDDAPEARLGLAQLLFGVLALGDLAHNYQYADNLAALAQPRDFARHPRLASAVDRFGSSVRNVSGFAVQRFAQHDVDPSALHEIKHVPGMFSKHACRRESSQ